MMFSKLGILNEFSIYQYFQFRMGLPGSNPHHKLRSIILILGVIFLVV